ncbi:uncharacterized protein C6orf118 isoform X1 [Mastacembelus armatus]|nr:uncharacterized protein C6orf118 homolog isoform X1 [Mastacembelus armatus]
MSSSCKPKSRCFRSDIPRLAAKAGQKADILTYSSGHLGPLSCLSQSQSHRETKQPFWKLSQSRKETPNPLTLQQRQKKALTCVKKKEIKESPSEFTSGTALVESQVSGSRQDQATDHLSYANRREGIRLPKTFICSSDSLLVQPRAFSHKKCNFSSSLEGKRQFCSSQSDQEGLNNDDHSKKEERVGRPDPWAAVNVAEIHERKLRKELKKLSTQSWPHRDRLAVFSDVFDDVCESSPVFGHILREIKTDYDLYVNHMMASQSPLHHMSQNTSLEVLGNCKIRKTELEDSGKEVWRLEQEARKALEENKRVRNELQNVPAFTGPDESHMKHISLSELQDNGTANSHANSVQSKRLQVLNAWREIQQLEEEIKEKLVSTIVTTATQKHIKVLKTETVRLNTSNEQMKTINKDMESKINKMLNREKSSNTLRRVLWDEIWCDLQTATD